MSKLMTYSLVSIIVILITALIFFKFQGNLKDIYAEATAKQTCKTSVYMASKLKLIYADFINEIKCPTIKLDIDDKNEGIAKKKVADAMYDCWDQFGRGKLELFSDDNVYCHICHRVTFGEEVKVDRFMEYLASNKVPAQKVSYLQFLTTEKTKNSDFLNELENKKIEDEIDASKNNEYAVIFTYIKGKDYLDKYLEKAKYTAPGLGLIALGFGIIKVGGAAGGVVSATVAGAPVGVIISLGSLTTGGFLMMVGALWSGLAGYFSDVPFEHIALISFIPYDAQHIQDLNCRELPIKQ